MYDKRKTLKKLKEVYDHGGNIIQYLRRISCESSNSMEDIMISYDFQAGSYIDALRNDPEVAAITKASVAN